MYQTQLINLKSNKKKTYFAPEWNHYIFEGIVKDIDFSIISKLILDNESKIKEEHQHSGYDGNTGLGDSLTSRFGFYNVLDWPNEEIYKLKQLIKMFHAKFLNDRLEPSHKFGGHTECFKPTSKILEEFPKKWT